ncbi:hypothetical protein TSUD_254260 [Trifolium subterraneum]|uniref:Legume lectin domain-containing protein n=1 Tax=Trifolium subterraneum TaxID=3900 RepID=A0A2Z6PH06_TRISU|nr:hypothetical protein TSUD_254260 [Trifolium subterraneum]
MALHGKNPFMAILLLIFFVSSYASFSAHTTEFEFEYPSFQNSWVVDMAGDTFVNRTTFSVQLTSPSDTSPTISCPSTIRPAVSSLHSYGTMVYPSPILFFHHGRRRTNKAFSFTTNFSFSISHTNHSFYGEGFAFFIMPKSAADAPPAPQPSFAVAFETKSIEYSSISIIKNFERSPLWTVQIDKQFMNLKSGDQFYSWIEYDSSIDFLSVFLSKDIHHPSVPFIVVTDLLNSFLRDYTFMDIGFMALSLKMSEIYSIHSWNFTSSKVENKLIEDKSYGFA